MKGIFITGTDTGAGKTIISGLLGRYLLAQGYRVITQKWIQTGSRGFSGDINLHLRLMQKQKKEIKDYLSYVSPYVFRFSSSPHLAARLQKSRISEDKIKEAFRFLAKKFDFVIVEGIGGALVPVNKKSLLIEIAAGLNLPALVIAANKLGAVNHTLLTIEAIKKRRMKIAGIIFNNTSNKVNKLILNDNVHIIKALTKEKIFGIFPYIRDKKHLYRTFIPLGRKIFPYVKKKTKK